MTSSRQLIDRANITYRQLDHWCHAGILHPIGDTGSGYQREFTPAEVEIAGIMSVLVRAGLQPKAARAWAEDIRALGRVHVGEFVLTHKEEVAT